MVVASSLAVSACVGSGEGVPLPVADSGAVPKTYEELVTMLFEPSCVQQCHVGGAAPKGLSLEPHALINGLVGVPSVEVPSMLRVAPGQPQESYLVTKLVVTDPRRGGSRMPRNGPPFFTNQQILAVKQWIAAGATTDWVADESLLGGDVADVDGDVAGDDAAADDAIGPDDAALDAEVSP